MISRPFALTLLAGIAMTSPLAAQPMTTADTNHDGSIDAAEREAMHRKP